jgi:hypothetical protein
MGQGDLQGRVGRIDTKPVFLGELAEGSFNSL